jgi:Reverse transcriptase (RNA-dependent DNA polymerase)
VIDLHRALRDRGRFRRQIERLFDRFPPAAKSWIFREEGVPLDAVFERRRRLARLLVRTIRQNAYEFQPGRIREIRVQGKSRDVFSFKLVDLIVHGVVADIIEDAAAPLLAPELYSYRKGVSWWHAVSRFSEYVRAHRRARPDPRSRGLYVLRRDVDAYTDSIPVGDASPLWGILRGLFESSRSRIMPDDWQILESVVRPVAHDKQGRLISLLRGVPTGQPVACVLFNLYLHELDHELAAISGGFYARYSDDILFAHPDAGIVRTASEAIERILSRLDLRLKSEKSLDLFLNAAGRNPAPPSEARGSPYVPFLGLDVWADGTTSLGREKTRALLQDCAARARLTVRALRGAPIETRGKSVCAALNRSLAVETLLFQEPAAPLLRRVVTRRPKLLELDFLIAKTVIEAVTGEPGNKGFRILPYRTLREDWGLESLFHGRNIRPSRAA